MSNLWPDFSDLKPIKMPKSILEEQASYLAESTNGKVYGSVEESKYYSEDGIVISRNSFDFDFFIKGKFLPNYKFKAFSINHDIVMYPVNITVEPDIGEELQQSLELKVMKKEIEIESDDEVIIWDINNENELVSVLSIIFKTEKLRNVIVSLISLS